MADIKWAMVIDLDRCTGCQTCVIACRAENNIAIQGPSEVEYGRGHYWMRVERYWEGDYPNNLKARHMPIPCQQCQNAPCEPVCPVYASVHDDADKLNSQVYNRCIGTFYCANNCPYYVRFFNWWDYRYRQFDNMDVNAREFWQYLNPDVTVRSRGIMEKCTFCIQRIRRARVLHGVKLGSEEHVPDGAVQPACVQACPTGALQFGDVSDPTSRVALLSQSGRRFHLLEELGTETSVFYMKENL